MRTVLPLIKNIRAPLGKNVMVPLGLTEAASTTDTAIQKKSFGSGMTTLLILNEDIMKIVKSLNLDGYKSLGTHLIAFYVKASHDVTYFDSFRLENIQKQIKEFIDNKNIMTNIYRIQAYDSVM